jgi:nucleoside-triphosphatase
MFSRGVRQGTARAGFEIVDVASTKVGWFAHVDQQGGPQVGKYHVNPGDLDSVGFNAINNAIERSDVVAIDEIGTMEVLSAKFKEATQKALESGKLVIAVVHQKAQDKLVANEKPRADTEVFTVTAQNREPLT